MEKVIEDDRDDEVGLSDTDEDEILEDESTPNGMPKKCSDLRKKASESAAQNSATRRQSKLTDFLTKK